MKNYKEVSYRYLKNQRNRNLLTILGIILSVALISSIGIMMISAKGALVKDAIRTGGSYHAKFNNIDSNSIDKLINHTGISEVGKVTLENTAIVKEATEYEREKYNIDMPYRCIDISAYEEKSLEMLPHKLKHGRMPKSSDEIVISDWVIDYFDRDIKVGDKVKLTIGNRIKLEGEEKKETFETIGEKTYTLVGTIEEGYFWRGELVTGAITLLDENIVSKSSYDVYIKIPDIKNANEKIESIANDIGKSTKEFEYNDRLLRLSGESMNNTLNRSMMGMVIFIIILIIICTIAVIYNTFNISVLERITQFGLLRSVGATPQQIRGIVLKEAFVLSIIGIPLGLLLGLSAMKVVLYIITSISTDISLFNDMEIISSKSVLLVSSIIGFITIFLSAIVPAIMAGKVSPLEAVRNTGSFKKDSIGKVRRGVFIRKVFGVEAEIAYKNLKRNRKRFIITVFSMVISISLFITFSSFSDYMFNIGVMDGRETVDFTVRGVGDSKSEEVYSKLKDFEDVGKVYKLQSDTGGALIKKSKISEKLKEMNSNLFEVKEDKLVKVHNVEISTLGDDNFDELKKVLEKGTLDIDRLNEDNGVLVINNTMVYNEETKKITRFKGYNLDIGDEISYSSYNMNDDEEIENYKKFKIMGILEKGVISEGTNYNTNGSIKIITTEKVWREIFTDNNNNKTSNVIQSIMEANSSMLIEMIENGDKSEITSYLNELEDKIQGFNYIDFSEMAKESRKVAIIMSIFLYGFVSIITLISSINIINTISTNIMLRTKEIATIKAVGMSQFGIKTMVALESLYYGIYASIIGGTIGTGLSYILFSIIIGIREFEWSIPWVNIIIACLGTILIALLSGIYPLKRINDKIIVESIKAED